MTLPLATRRPRASALATRQAILDAALQEFSTRGYDAVGTRDIAAAAGIEQGHLAYYFASKEGLWRDTVASFNAAFTALLAEENEDGAEVLSRMLRYFADNRALTRLMLQEFSVQSVRHDWLVNGFGRPAWKRLEPLFVSLAARRPRPVDPAVLYFSFLGAALVFFGSSQEATAIAGSTLAGDAAKDAFIALQMETLFGIAPG